MDGTDGRDGMENRLAAARAALEQELLRQAQAAAAAGLAREAAAAEAAEGAAAGGRPFAEAFDVHPKQSLAFATDGAMHLVGDDGAPGNSKYYGTSGAGAKGFHALPTDTNDQVKADADDPAAGYLDAKVRYSIEVDAVANKMQLVGDEDAPGADHVYGTDNSATPAKGWQAFDDLFERVLAALATTMTSPDYVLGKKTVTGTTTYGWVATTSHADEHPE